MGYQKLKICIVAISHLTIQQTEQQENNFWIFAYKAVTKKIEK